MHWNERAWKVSIGPLAGGIITFLVWWVLCSWIGISTTYHGAWCLRFAALGAVVVGLYILLRLAKDQSQDLLKTGAMILAGAIPGYFFLAGWYNKPTNPPEREEAVVAEESPAPDPPRKAGYHRPVNGNGKALPSHPLGDISLHPDWIRLPAERREISLSINKGEQEQVKRFTYCTLGYDKVQLTYPGGALQDLDHHFRLVFADGTKQDFQRSVSVKRQGLVTGVQVYLKRNIPSSQAEYSITVANEPNPDVYVEVQQFAIGSWKRGVAQFETIAAKEEPFCTLRPHHRWAMEIGLFVANQQGMPSPLGFEALHSAKVKIGTKILPYAQEGRPNPAIRYISNDDAPEGGLVTIMLDPKDPALKDRELLFFAAIMIPKDRRR